MQQAITEYQKRLTKYCRLQIIELADERAPEKLSAAEAELVKTKEGERILNNIKTDSYCIALVIAGKQCSSEQLAQRIDALAIQGKSNISFVIGGSLGLSEQVMERAEYKLSFSEMTFPHQLMRILLLEQVYRAFKINKNEPYHK